MLPVLVLQSQLNQCEVNVLKALRALYNITLFTQKLWVSSFPRIMSKLHNETYSSCVIMLLPIVYNDVLYLIPRPQLFRHLI